MFVKILRHTIQVLALILLIIPVFYMDTIWYGTYIGSGLGRISLTDPLTFLEMSLAAHTLWVPLLMAAIPMTLVAILGGRLFCSYICPLGFLLDIIPLKKKAVLKNKRLPVLALCCVLVADLISGLPIFDAFSPTFAFMRIIVFGMGVETLFVLLVVLAGLKWGKKIWCRALCPLGAIYGLLGAKRRLAVVVDHKKCTGCNHCAEVCSMGTDPRRSDLDHIITCTNCGDCKRVCEGKAIHYTLKGCAKN